MGGFRALHLIDQLAQGSTGSAKSGSDTRFWGLNDVIPKATHTVGRVSRWNPSRAESESKGFAVTTSRVFLKTDKARESSRACHLSAPGTIDWRYADRRASPGSKSDHLTRKVNNPTINAR